VSLIKQSHSWVGLISVSEGTKLMHDSSNGVIEVVNVRWDTPQHVLVDDPDSDTEQSKIWPGEQHCPYRASQVCDCTVMQGRTTAILVYPISIH
jgi:hypothetical protein